MRGREASGRNLAGGSCMLAGMSARWAQCGLDERLVNGGQLSQLLAVWDDVQVISDGIGC